MTHPDAPFELKETFLHLTDGPDVIPLDVGEDFWEKLASRTDLGDGRLVSSFRFDADWPTWERHPAGEEVVVLINGSLDFVLETESGEKVVPLRGRGAVVVPRGVWHTARVNEPSEALFITRGAGTENRAI
jgi:hypothetical protein